MEVTLKGNIGTTDNMIPTKIWQTREREGKHVQVPFMTFRMFAEDLTKPMVKGTDGIRRRQRSVVQVILPENKRGQALFEILAGGRRVLVYGRQTHRPNVGTDKDGNVIAYPNPVVYLDRIEFLDEPFMLVSDRILNVLLEKKAINDGTKEELLAVLKEHHESLRKTVNERTEKNPEGPPETKDPNKLDFKE